MGLGLQLTESEIKFLTENYAITLNKELSKKLGRSTKSISYFATKLRLKKDYKFYCKSRKKLNFEISKEVLQDLYFNQNISIREIAKRLGVGKTTIGYYFDKYKLNRRSKGEATKIRAQKFPTWTKGKTKENNPSIAKLAENIKKAYLKKREERFRQIEQKFGKSLKEIINDLYWKENLIQNKIAEKLGINRKFVIDLMLEYDISKKPNFRIIASLKGKNHPMYGKTWESIYGPEEAARIKKEASLRSRKSIIKRLQNNKMPFFHTKIEIIMAEELRKRDILFESQYPITGKFVCDFAIPKYKIAIECDGDYWHSNPKIYDANNLGYRQKQTQSRDRKKEKYLEKLGWRVLRFYESDILGNVKKCVDDVEIELKNINWPLNTL